MLNMRNKRGFTLTELAATLGIFALSAAVLAPSFTGTPVSSNPVVSVSNEAPVPAGATPYTPPVNGIVIDITNTTTNITQNILEPDHNATSTTVEDLNPQASYSVSVAKRNSTGLSSAIVAEVQYVKIGEETRDVPTSKIVPDETKPILVNDETKPIMANDTSKPTQWNQKITGYRNTAVTGYRYSTVTGYRNQVVGYNSYISGYGSMIVGYGTRTETVPGTQTCQTVQKGGQSFSYPCTKTRARSSCGNESYSYSCTKTVSYPSRCPSTYACGTRYKPKTCATDYACTLTKEFASTCTGTRAKRNCGTEDYQSTCNGRNPIVNVQECTTGPSSTRTVTDYGSPRYGTDYSNPQYSTDYNSPIMGINYNDPIMGINYNDPIMGINYNDPIMANDLTAPIAWDQKRVGFEKKTIGHLDKTITVQVPTLFDVRAGRTQSTSIVVPDGKLLLDPTTVGRNINMTVYSNGRAITYRSAWSTAKVLYKGSNASQNVGSTVRFIGGKTVTLNGSQFISVDAKAVR
jgi:prepilin-type N-terminal cleavage/methylation domain-containing protein